MFVVLRPLVPPFCPDSPVVTIHCSFCVHHWNRSVLSRPCSGISASLVFHQCGKWNYSSSVFLNQSLNLLVVCFLVEYNMSFVNGKVPKFRASCDGCNEAKVRCSQKKPECERCRRQGISCVYGLSRRSHRTARRIGEQMAPALESCLSDGGHDRTFTARWTGRAGRTELAPELMVGAQEDEARTADKNILTSSDLMPLLDTWAQQSPDSAFDLTFNPPNDLSTVTSDLLSQYYQAPATSPTVVGSDRRDSCFVPWGRDETQSPANSSCDCNSLVLNNLLSLPSQSEEGNIVLNAQFGQLRHAINIAEQCIGCACTSQNEISISMRRTLFLTPPLNCSAT